MLVQQPSRLRTRPASPVAINLLVVAQIVTSVAYVRFIFSGPNDPVLIADLEFGSFFVVPFVWLALFPAGRWLSRRPLSREHALAIRACLAVSGAFGVFALAIMRLVIVDVVMLQVTDF